MDEFRPARRRVVATEMNQLQTRLFFGFAHRRVVNRFTWVDVAAGLQPHVQAFVQMQNDARLADDDRRGRDVGRIGVFVERCAQFRREFAKHFYRLALAVVDRFVFGEFDAKLSHKFKTKVADHEATIVVGLAVDRDDAPLTVFKCDQHRPNFRRLGDWTN